MGHRRPRREHVPVARLNWFRRASAAWLRSGLPWARMAEHGCSARPQRKVKHRSTGGDAILSPLSPESIPRRPQPRHRSRAGAFATAPGTSTDRLEATVEPDGGQNREQRGWEPSPYGQHPTLRPMAGLDRPDAMFDVEPGRSVLPHHCFKPAPQVPLGSRRLGVEVRLFVRR